ncbi:hypothetical protein MMC11_002445 [Xylographa trunciseda]|nr:hypothetical protein [Xylographa trunciseda]
MTTSANSDAVTKDEPVPQNMSQNNRTGSGTDLGHITRRSPSPSQPLQRASTTPLPPPTSSATTSPRSSRDPSPVRPPFKPGVSSAAKLARSRKNSQDLSPHRASNASGPGVPSVPSAAAIQRALSATGTPQLPSPATPEYLIDAPRPQKSSKASVGTAGLSRAPVPPRLRSPPISLSTTPNRSSIYSPRRTDHVPLTPSITLDRPTPTSASSLEGDTEETENIPRAGMRTPVKGTIGSNILETVQEGSLPKHDPSAMETVNQLADKDHPPTTDESLLERSVPRMSNTPMESGSESGGNRTTRAKSENKDERKASVSHTKPRPTTVNAKKSFSQLNLTKAKIAAEGSVRNMTVETETVSSVPQVAVGGGAGERGASGRTDTSGSIRLKPSIETIRPKKEKKRAARKTPSINSGTGGSSRRFHHHHIHSRAPSPRATSPEPSTSPDFRYASDQFHYSTGYGPVPRRGLLTQPAVLEPSLHSPLLKVRQSSTVLTSFRGRTASSKADIFEAKVASAVDEANSSDSEETFVYESNPPEPLSARPNRYHSRTPSATSMASQVDHHGNRFRQDGHHSITGKKSMKFTNHPNYSHGDPVEGGRNGTLGSGRSSGGNHSHHHHIGRYGRGTAGHTSLFDNESPFPNAAKPLRTSGTNGSRISPRPATPRSPHLMRASGFSKSNIPLAYDLEGEGADDERMPLVGSVRSGRTRNSRRPPIRSDARDDVQTTGFCRRLSGCIALAIVVGLLVAAIVVALVLCSKPLFEVHIREIQSVIVSEQELMFDLHVHAVNPNIVAIQVTELSIDIFAKSKYVATDASWGIGRKQRATGLAQDYSRHAQQRGSKTDRQEYWTQDGIDEGNDPIQDPEGDPQLQLLGRILEFDSPLIFEASPLRHHSLSSIGEVRLAKPGNHTKGVSQWWEKAIQHPFELRVKGPIYYSLPISSRLRTATISGSILVQPEAPIDDHDSRFPRTSEPSTVTHKASERSQFSPDQGIRFAA